MDKEHGGFGIKSIRVMNDSLLCKWLWRFSTDTNAKWRQILGEKYGVQDNGWDVKPVKQTYGTSQWRGITNRLEIFTQGIVYSVASGHPTKFWLDTWTGDTPLCLKFPELFEVSRKKQGWVADFYRDDAWDIDPRRRLTDTEIQEATQLCQQLDGVTLNAEQDSRRWKWEKEGMFSVQSCYNAITISNNIPDFRSNKIWIPLVPPKVSFFVWLLHHNSIMTQDNLAHRGVTLDNKCVLCKKELESINHLFLNCNYTHKVWMAFMLDYGRDWVMCKDIKHMFLGQHIQGLTERARTLWKLLPFAVCWVIWRKRNKRIFEKQEKVETKVIEAVKATLLYWNGPNVEFRGVAYQDLLRQWGNAVNRH